jgi:hypothetical protein
LRKLGGIVPLTALAAALVLGWSTTGHPAEEAAAGQWHHSCEGDPMRCALHWISIGGITLTLGCAGKERCVLLASSQRSLIESCAIRIDNNETISGTVVRGKCWFLARFKTRKPDLVDQMKQGDQVFLRINYYRDRDTIIISLKGFAEELAKLD